MKAPELVKALPAYVRPAELSKQLFSGNGWAEKQARQLLVKYNDDFAWSTRAELLRDPLNNGGDNERAALEELWIWRARNELYIVKDYFDELTKRLSVLLNSKDERYRAAAARIVGSWAGHTPGIPTLATARFDPNTKFPSLNATLTEMLAKAVQDDHPRVRIEALRALARIPTARAAELALSVLDKGQVEGFLEYALWLTINDLAEPWATAVESGAWKIEGREKQLQYALKAIEPRIASRLMTKLVSDKPFPRDGSGGMVELIGQAGSSLKMRFMFDQVLNGGFDDDGAVRALNSLLEAARLRNVRPSGDPTTISKLLDNPNENIRAAAAKLVGSWKQASLAPTLNKLASEAGASTNLRRSAIEGLRELGGRDAVASLRTLTKDKDDSIRRSAAAALASADLNGSMPQILEVVSATTKEEEALALWRSLLAAKGASPALTKALATNSLPEPVAKAGLRAAREGGRNEPNLVLALNKAGSISDPTAALTEGEIHAIAYEVTKGDPANGEKIYRNKQLGCVLCHSIGGAGGKVGPDMTSLGASTPLADYIVEAVLLPNKKVKEGFNSVQISTKDGEDIAGNLVREDAEQVILRDATAKEVSIAKRNIQSRRMGGSLMPAGLLDFISPQERLDLYAFLAQLGKPGPYDATKQNVARVWRLNSKVGTVNADEMLKSDLRGQDWTPVYATVGGALPKSEVMAELDGKDATVWLASRFQTAKAGPTRFKVTGTASPKAWIDGKPIGGDGDLSVDLPAGPHTFFLKVTTTDIASGLKLESNDVTFLVE